MSVLEDRDRGCFMRPAALTTASFPVQGLSSGRWSLPSKSTTIALLQQVGVPSGYPLACGLGSEGTGTNQWVN